MNLIIIIIKYFIHKTRYYDFYSIISFTNLPSIDLMRVAFISYSLQLHPLNLTHTEIEIIRKASFWHNLPHTKATNTFWYMELFTSFSWKYYTPIA